MEIQVFIDKYNFTKALEIRLFQNLTKEKLSSLLGHLQSNKILT